MSTSRAFERNLYSIDARDALQRWLMQFNRVRLSPALPSRDWMRDIEEHRLGALAEGRFLESERAAVADVAAATPEHPDDYLQWFQGLRETGPGQFDPLFDWLATQADLPEMRWFLGQEMAGEAGFDDLVALTQVRLPTIPKLEMARNYWDEMGRGREVRMHGPMLHHVGQELDLACTIENTVWEALALANLMAGLACNRRYAYHSVGALGAVELTAPTRVNRVDRGLRRLGASPRARSYFSLHASIDLVHSRGWNAEVIRPLVADRPELRIAIAEGALMRLKAGARCFERYRKALMPAQTQSPAPRLASARRETQARST